FKKNFRMQHKFILFLIVAFCSVLTVNAQEEEQFMENDFRREVVRSARLVGKIVDAESNKGIEAASIQVLVPATDKVTGERKDSVIAGTLTRSNGDFSIHNIVLPDIFILRVSSIGFDPFEQVFESNAPKEGNQMFTRDMGNIALATSEGEKLSEVTIIG